MCLCVEPGLNLLDFPGFFVGKTVYSNMIKILWKLLEIVDNNWGYYTPLQKRFKVNDKCKISSLKTQYTPLEIGDEVTVIETGRWDYLVRRADGITSVVFQFELV